MTGAGRKPVPTGRKSETSFPGLAGASKTDGGAQHLTEYEELQRDELLALQSIYGDDYEEHAQVRGAWQKKSTPSFEICVKERVGDSDDQVSVKLRVVFTATYPKTLPVLSLHNWSELPDATRLKIEALVDSEPKSLIQPDAPVGIIYELVELIRDVLRDSAQAIVEGKALPSLEEEREIHNHEVQKMLQDQKEEEERQRLEEIKEEQRMMSHMLGAEMERQKQLQKESTKVKSWPHQTEGHRRQPGGDGRIRFDRLCRAIDRSGNSFTFTAVTAKEELETGPLSRLYMVRPILTEGHGPTIVLKETVIRVGNKDPKDVRKHIKAIEESLENFKSKVGPDKKNILQIIDFKIDMPPINSSGDYTISILFPLARKGSLASLLECSLPNLARVRDWTRDLLDGLHFLHTNHITHQSIHPGNIVLAVEPTGEVVPKLADADYQRQLHSLSSTSRGPIGIGSARSSGWLAPEIAGSSKPVYTPKTDVWDFGIVFLQMAFGPDVVTKYKAPEEVRKNVSPSPQLLELITRFFRLDPVKRSRPFELSSSEFLATDAPLEAVGTAPAIFTSGSPATPSLMPPLAHSRVRRDSSNRGIGHPTLSHFSRYEADYVEEGRLGKGGFGEVVKARLKLDGRVYAVKKISQKSKASLTEVLKEIKLLAALNHPAVVRYYHTWLEEQLAGSDDDDDESDDSDGALSSGGDDDDDETSTSRGHVSKHSFTEDLDDIPFEFAHSSGLDFISSTHQVHMSDDEDEEEDGDDSSSDDDSDDDTASLVARSNFVGSPAPKAPRFRTTLYIAMEYCEKRTLRDLIMHRKLHKDTSEIWRLFRQILEGLAHIHALNIVHRDMKPDNIFLTPGADGLDQVKIGDFGLATSGQFAAGRLASSGGGGNNDRFTSNVGTLLYCAPEMFSAGSGMYSNKVDMYSLGVILFEMCYHPVIGMERADVLQKLRGERPTFPSDFKPADKTLSEIVVSLLTRNPRDRPSSAELLAGDKLPVQVESEDMRRVLAGIADPASAYRPKALSTFFAAPWQAAKDYAFDLAFANPPASELTNCQAVKAILVSIFRRHGALEVHRSSLYPASRQITDPDVVRMLDTNGNVLQLPFDLTLGHARELAKSSGPVIERCYTFGTVFRDKKDTTQPRVFGVVDFDIVATDTLDLALKEAEILKVLDEIIVEMPPMSPGGMCFLLGHSDLLQLILEFCGIPQEKRRKTTDTLSRLNVHGYTWAKARAELRAATHGLSNTSVDELRRFDFRDTPSKVFAKIKSLFEGTNFTQRAAPVFAHLKEVSEYTKRLRVATKLYISPLTSFRENFYRGGIMFTCQYDKKNKDVFAAGGRYDDLIREHRMPKPRGGDDERHAVGFSLAWERIARIQKTGNKYLKKPGEDAGGFSEQRCDVLVASFNSDTLRSTGINILNTLWAHNISAQLAKDARTPEELLLQTRDAGYLWVVIIKESSLKIKQLAKREAPDVDVPIPQLVSWIKQESDERQWQAGAKMRAQHETAAAGAAASSVLGVGSVGGGGGSSSAGDRSNKLKVTMVLAQNKSKKFNRQAAVEAAEAAGLGLLQAFGEGHVISSELSDRTLEMIRHTGGVGDSEGWKRVEAGAPATERKYVRELLELLVEMGREQNEKRRAGGVVGAPGVLLHNFRSGSCFIYQF